MLEPGSHYDPFGANYPTREQNEFQLMTERSIPRRIRVLAEGRSPRLAGAVTEELKCDQRRRSARRDRETELSYNL
jgi:hypothetical protein